MKPIDYIFKNLGCINTTVLEQLITDAGETVSEEIYDYLKETPLNTNTAILKQMGLDIERSDGESEEVFELTFSGHSNYGHMIADKTAAEIKEAIANNMKMHIVVVDMALSEESRTLEFTEIVDTPTSETSGSMTITGYSEWIVLRYNSLDSKPSWSI